jgi:hypothetical protein
VILLSSCLALWLLYRSSMSISYIFLYYTYCSTEWPIYTLVQHFFCRIHEKCKGNATMSWHIELSTQNVHEVSQSPRNAEKLLACVSCIPTTKTVPRFVHTAFELLPTDPMAL